VREGFLLFMSFREISFTTYSSSEITKTYLRLSSAKILLNSPGKAPQFLCHNSIQLYGCPNNKCCTDCLGFYAKFLLRLYRICSRNSSSKTVPFLLENCVVQPSKIVPIIYTDSTEFHLEINDSRCLDFCANK
jgi:hypothetical protein